MQHKRILIIGASHGNELLGVKLYQRLLQKRSATLQYIDFLIGNPRAYHEKVRYIETDLNRSYQTSVPASYEQQRAAYIQDYIAATTPDIVLDMHTTVCEQPPCIIVHDLDGAEKRRFLRAAHIDNILQVVPMGDIAVLGDNVIGYEVMNRQITPDLLDDIEADIDRYIDMAAYSATKQLFVMQDKIFKRDVTPDQAKTFVNFQHHELGFTPILTGNNSYAKQTDYLGFKSSHPEEITL